jgi:hypothetical protein
MVNESEDPQEKKPEQQPPASVGEEVKRDAGEPMDQLAEINQIAVDDDSLSSDDFDWDPNAPDSAADDEEDADDESGESCIFEYFFL